MQAFSIKHFCFELEIFADLNDKELAEIASALHLQGIVGLKWANCLYFDEIVSQFAIGALRKRFMPFDTVFGFAVELAKLPKNWQMPSCYFKVILSTFH